MNIRKNIFGRGLVALALATVPAAGFAPTASAQAATTATASQTYQANLVQANGSGASGTATVTVTGNSIRVVMKGTGFSANQAHASHIHIGGQSACPAPSADTNKDGYVDTKEADKSAGAVKVALTSSGDTSDKSALALDRAPKADAKGNLSYDRTFTLPSGVASNSLAKASVDVHGISTLFDDKGKYDGSKKSELDNKVAFEATVPAACGTLSSAPVGGAATGAGSLGGIESPVMLAIGGTSLIAAIALGFVARKQLAASN